jgi:hypothetical protein
MATVYSFVLDSFTIENTRSLHDDTDYLSWTLAVIPEGSQPNPQTKVKSMGAINSGTHTVNLQFQNVTVNPTDTVILSYLIFNAGSSSRVEVETTLEKVAAQLVTAGASLDVPQLDSALSALSKWLPVQVKNITKSLCDGTVAVEQDQFTGPGFPLSHFTSHQGGDVSIFCSASLYIVRWHTSQGPSFSITTVIDLNGTWASGGVPGPVISINGDSISVDMSAYKRPTASGLVLDSSDITVTFPDDKTYTGKLQPPNRIEWSNNSEWTKV